MLELRLFRNPSFTGVSIVAFCLSAGMFAMFLYLTLYIQDVLAFSPLEAGLRFLPLSVVSFVVAPLSARFSDRVPYRAMMGTGLILVGLGLILMGGISVDDAWTQLLPGLIIAGIGIGMTNPGIAAVAVGVVEPARAGMASGINSTFRQAGIATGVAALGAIFQHRVAADLTERLPQAPSGFSDAVSSGAADSALASLPEELRAQASAAAEHAFITGLNEILLIGAGIAIVGGIASWLLVRNSDLLSPTAAPPRPAGERTPSETEPAAVA